ncbi:hypothetical protein [Aeoliella sp.]|uniref:hypothetical protein n=1 Tax=Aeoliella sp. TaxID=2795800 RepID=UPI003CCC042E
MEEKRDARGRFLPGHAGGPGRKPKPPGNRYARYLGEVVTESEFKRLIRVTLERAQSGDAKARDWLAKWLLSKDRPLPPTAEELAAASEADAGERETSDRRKGP